MTPQEREEGGRLQCAHIFARIRDALDMDDPPAWAEKWARAPIWQTNMPRVLALSGGKDSTAMAIACGFLEPGEITYVCTPTGNELPEMEAHWSKLEDILGQPIKRIGDRTLMGLIVEQKALPNHRARWCTRILKLENYYGWLATLGPCVSHVGLRADEESRPGMIFPNLGDIQMDFPMRRWGWTLEDVLAFLDWIGVTVPDRTDCAVCFWQKLGEWYLLWRDHNDLFEQGVCAERVVSTLRGQPYTFRSPDRDAWPAGLESLGAEFAAGRIPTRSLKMMDKRRLAGACRACTL